MTIQDKTRLYTAADLWELSKRPEYADKSIELTEGYIVEVAASSIKPSLVTHKIELVIGNYVDEHNLGYVTNAEGGYELSPTTVLAPDVGFIAKARITSLPERYFPGAPDLAIEVVSSTDSVKATQRKAAKYLAFGTRLVWIFYPAERAVDACTAIPDGGMIIHEIDIDGMLDGGDILPGFKVAVRDVFKVLDLDKE